MKIEEDISPANSIELNTNEVSNIDFKIDPVLASQAREEYEGIVKQPFNTKSSCDNQDREDAYHFKTTKFIQDEHYINITGRSKTCLKQIANNSKT
jgi:hypothetical protein